MAKLTARLHGQEIANLELVDGHEYHAGRADDVAIVLPNQKGISRHHLKFYQRGDIWVVELLARFGQLIRGDQTGEVLELTSDCSFSAPPFEFTFSLAQPVQEQQPAPKAEDLSLRMPTVRTSMTHNQPPSEEMPQQVEDPGNNDATMVGVGSQLVPYVRITNKTTGKEEVIKLEGHLWVAGRDSSCEIHLEESRSSRRHFELSRTKEGFFITDLESANGTLLNDEALTSDEPWQLTSGDVIKVANTKIIFEVRDLAFGQRLPALTSQPTHSPPPQMMHNNPYMPMPYDPMAGGMNPYGNGGAAVVKVENKKFDFKKHRVRIAIAALVPVLLYGMFNDKKPANVAENSSTTPSFEEMTPEKKQAVKNSFNLAMNMYMQTRYQLCVAELKKLHEMVPAYENSKELLNFCEHGSELLRKKEDSDRLAREQAESERAIMQVVEDCTQTLKPTTTLDEIRVCLAPAIERSPEHPGVISLIAQVQGHQDDRDAKKQAADSQRQRREVGIRIFEKAKELYKAGELAKAATEYEKFINGGYSNLSEQRTEAQRDVAQVRKELGTKVSGLVQACRENLEKSQYKPAYLACEKALKEDPSNADAKELKPKVIAEMRRELKSMYEDSVLEESMGNIDTAKERWKQIMDKGIPDEEYHKKAKRNLQKYGAT